MVLEYKHLRDLPERSWTQVAKLNIRKTEQYTNGIHLPKSKQVDPSNWDSLHAPFHWHPFEQVPKPTSSVSSSGSGWESYPREPTQTWFMGSKAQPETPRESYRHATPGEMFTVSFSSLWHTCSILASPTIPFKRLKHVTLLKAATSFTLCDFWYYIIHMKGYNRYIV